MHNLKKIRENPDLFKKKILDRDVKINLDDLFKLDKKKREIIQKKEKLEQDKKAISKTKDKSYGKVLSSQIWVTVILSTLFSCMRLLLQLRSNALSGTFYSGYAC